MKTAKTTARQSFAHKSSYKRKHSMVHLSIYASHCFNTTSQKQPQLKKGMNKMSAFLMHLLIQAIM